VKVQGKTISDLFFLEMPDLLTFPDTIDNLFAGPVTKKMQMIIKYLIDIIVGYLSLHPRLPPFRVVRHNG
jgi:hypothetical protein